MIDPPTIPLQVPRTGGHRLPRPPHHRRRTAVVVAVVVLALGATAGAIALWPSSTGAPAAPIAAATGLVTEAPPRAPAPSAAAPTTTTRAASSCPEASTLVAEYRRHGTSPTRARAADRGAVTCAGGFAVMKIRSPGDSETVTAIFAVGPPVAFREAGTGPICTDDAALLPGSTVVPRSAATKLGCVSAAGTNQAPDPVLGSAQWGTPGFGSARPTTIDYGGDVSSSIQGIRWSSWGGARATGTGRAWYVAPGEQTATGGEEQATVVAWDLGTCAGRPAYRTVQWFFPQHGGALNAATATDACT